MKSVVPTLFLYLLVGLFATISNADPGKYPKALVILSSDSVQTQGMAMVLSNTMQAEGTRVQVLLCDKAGDLALAKKANSSKLKPINASPKMLLNKLRKGGAKTDVCALYLPNSEYTEADLEEGVGVAKPPQITAIMLSKDTQVFTF